MSETLPGSIRPDASELIICQDERYVCETYMFEPNASESALGRLYAVGEIEDRGGVGRELLDLTIQALQREYYRDPHRGALASFESALHQANLVLHDSAEQGVKDWMGYFHVAIAVLTGSSLHISTSGHAMVVLVRNQQTTIISQDLSHSPITNPLRTFAQVASGTLTSRDTLFLATSGFPDMFRSEDLIRFAIDPSAARIGTRLEQLYADKNLADPLAVLTVTILPEHVAHVATNRTAPLPSPRRHRDVSQPLNPRQPLVIGQSWLRTSLALLTQALITSWQAFKRTIWPAILRGSRHSGRAIVQASKKTTTTVQSQVTKWKQRPTTTDEVAAMSATGTRPNLRGGLTMVRSRFSHLPRSSRIFAGITIILAIALVVSVVLLRHKRADDAAISRASELVHEAQTKKQAAETALIYDNRDQARSLLADASKATDSVKSTGLYTPEVTQLEKDITTLTDRLQRIQRVGTNSLRVVGDFKSVLTDKAPTNLVFINNQLYTFNPNTNAIVSMTTDGQVASVSDTNQGIGFFTGAADQQADKTIVFLTSDPGIALFDAKTNTVQPQTIQLPSADAKITSAATFGNRLYLYDQTSQNIYSYNKTLRGYSNGTPWITAQNFPKDTIISIGIDSNIYTLHSDGTIRKLLKGEVQDFKTETVEPPLTSAKRLIKNENIKNMYVLDPTNKRVVVFDTKGHLQRQIFFDSATQLTDIALSPDEQTLYALDGTKVLAVPLAQ